MLSCVDVLPNREDGYNSAASCQMFLGGFGGRRGRRAALEPNFEPRLDWQLTWGVPAG